MNDLSALVERAQHGDATAYNQLVQRFQAMAISYGYAKLGDQQLAEDIAQEAFLYAHRTLEQLREPSAFPGWFRRVVQGQINRVQRKRRFLTVGLDQVADVPAKEADPSANMENQEYLRELFTAIDALPSHQRATIALFYVGNYSQQIISEFLEIPIATVKTRLHYARKQLKGNLQANEGTYPNNRKSVHDSLCEQSITTNVMRLFQAIQDDDLATVEELLIQNPSLVNAKGLEWSSFWHGEVGAIHKAVIYQHKTAVDLLLAHGADINQRVASNFSVLHFAANMALAEVISFDKGDELFDFLVARGAEPDIGVYVWRREPERVRDLLAADPSLANAIGVQHATPLCTVTDIDLAQLLLEYGADPFFRLENPYNKEYHADTPMRWAASRPENPEFFRFLLNYTNTPIDIHLACALGDVPEVARLLNEEPACVEARTGNDHVLLADFTPMHVAAHYRQPEVAKVLLEWGADPNAITSSVKDMTPLHLAVMYSAGDEDDVRVDVPRLLLAYGADVTLRDSVRQRTPLEWAEGKYMADEKSRRAVAALLRDFVKHS